MKIREYIVKLKVAVKSAFQHYSAIVISIIPCIIVSSLLGAILNICTQMPLVRGISLSEAYPLVAQWCSLLQVIIDCGIKMTPVYVTWSTVKRFRGTELLGIFVGLTMVPAGLANGLEWSALVEGGVAEYWNFALLQIPKAGFQGQMLVAIIGGAILVLLERKLTEAVPKGLHTFIVPLVSVTTTCVLVYLVVGPIARLIDQALLLSVDYLLREPSLKYLGGFLMGFFQLPAMMFGLHFALVPVNLQQVAAGLGSPLWPITVTSVLSAGGAALAVLLLTKDAAQKETAREGVLITLGLGTVEPALFGVCSKDRCAFLGAILAAGLSSFLCRFLNCTSTTFGLNGFFSFLTLPLEQWLYYAIAVVAAVGGGFLFTTLFYAGRSRFAKK